MIFIEQISGLLARLLPGGGTAGQVLKKASGSDYDVAWANEAGGSDGWTRVEVAADTSIPTGGVSPTGWSNIPLDANSDYEFELIGRLTTASTGTGIRFATSAIPSGATSYWNGLISGTAAQGMFGNYGSGTTYSGGSGWVAANALITWKIQGKIEVGATAGNVTFSFNTTTGTGTLKLGFLLKYRKI
jgi:hypothetical protein